MPEAQAEPPSATRFQAEKVRVGLEQLRLRLLDLTSRNKLISFRHTTSTIRVINANLDQVYGALTAGTKLPFQYVPEPTKEEIADRDEKPAARQYAEEIGWSVSFDLSPNGGRSDVLSVPHYKEDFETLVRKVATTAKTALDESGTNLLHLVFGFLEWRESDDSTQVRHAPLLVVPVRLATPRATEADRSIRLYYDDGDGLTANLSLVEKMRRDFGIELPTLQDDESPASYFRRVHEAVEHKRDWRICHQISLGLLSFAKLLMYLDLDMDRWPALGQHDRLVDIFASEAAAGMSFASEYDLDEEAKRAPLPSLICDADSSQHSALVDATRGNNLVIEGPPGTGKSQTITNLIAAFLSKGKRVLFVAEKMAALDVVKRRLDKARLGDFCLELHSHKTNKVGLLKSLEARIDAHRNFIEPTTLSHRAGLLATHREELTKYVKLLNSAYAALEKSPFELIWARDALRKTLNVELLEISSVAFPRCHEWTVVDFENRRDAVGVYQAHLSRYVEAGGSAAKNENPWAWLPTHELDLSSQRDLVERLGELRDLCERQLALVQAFARTFVDVTESPEEWLRGIASWKNALKDPLEDADNQLYEAFVSTQVKEMVRTFAADVESYHVAKKALPNGDVLLDSDLAERVEHLIEVLRTRGFESFTLEQLKSLHTSAKDATRQSVTAERDVQELGVALGVAAVFSIRCLTDLLSGRILLDAAPIELLHLRNEQYGAEGFGIRLQAAQRECDELLSQRAAISKEFDVQSDQSPTDLEDAASVLESTPWFKRWFSSNYRKARSIYQRHCLHSEKQRPWQMATGLRHLSQFKLRVETFERRCEHQLRLKEDFRGLDTAWVDLLAVAGWYEQIAIRLPEHQPIAQRVRHALLTLPSSRLKSILNAPASEFPPASEVQAFAATLEQLHALLPYVVFERDSTIISDFLETAKSIANPAASLLEIVSALGISGNTSSSQLKSWFEETRRLREVRSSLAGHKQAQEILGANFRGISTDTAVIYATLEFVSNLEAAEMPSLVKAWLLCAQYDERCKWLQDWLRDFEANADLLASKEKELVS